MLDSSWWLVPDKTNHEDTGLRSDRGQRGLSNTQAPTEEKEALAAHKRWLKASNGGMDPKQDFALIGARAKQDCALIGARVFVLYKVGKFAHKSENEPLNSEKYTLRV